MLRQLQLSKLGVSSSLHQTLRTHITGVKVLNLHGHCKDEFTFLDFRYYIDVRTGQYGSEQYEYYQSLKDPEEL